MGKYYSPEEMWEDFRKNRLEAYDPDSKMRVYKRDQAERHIHCGYAFRSICTLCFTHREAAAVLTAPA